MTDKLAAAIREFAVNNGHREYFTDGDMDGFDADPRFLSDLNALISEHYYPKEEIVNAVCPSCESDNCVLIAVPRNRCKDCGVEWDKENER